MVEALHLNVPALVYYRKSFDNMIRATENEIKQLRLWEKQIDKETINRGANQGTADKKNEILSKIESHEELLRRLCGTTLVHQHQ